VPYAADRFQAWSGQHLVILVLFALGLVAAAWWGRSHRDTPLELPARRGLAVALAAVALSMQAYQLTPGDFDTGTSLPLQLSDLATVSSVVALWGRGFRSTAFTYYVGLTLTTQAILTPSLAEAFPHPRYFGFWALHLLVVWSAVYLTWGLGIRPSWRGYRFAITVALVWAASMLVFNAVTGTNYGYLNRLPPSASLLDYLGPWPWYVVAEVAILATFWAVVLTWPWTRARPETAAGPRSRGSGRAPRRPPLR